MFPSLKGRGRCRFHLLYSWPIISGLPLRRRGWPLAYRELSKTFSVAMSSGSLMASGIESKMREASS